MIHVSSIFTDYMVIVGNQIFIPFTLINMMLLVLIIKMAILGKLKTKSSTNSVKYQKDTKMYM